MKVLLNKDVEVIKAKKDRFSFKQTYNSITEE